MVMGTFPSLSASYDEIKQRRKEEQDQTSTKRDAITTLVSFVVFGCLIHMSFSVVLSGTQDILAGTHIPTATVLSISMLPQFLIESIAPYFLKRVPHVVRVSIVFSTTFVGYNIAAFVDDVHWKIAGVGIITSGSASGLICIASILSYFSPSATAAYSTGCGIGIFTGTLCYTALTTWMCVTPKVTLALMSPLSILYVVSYYVIIRNLKDKKYLESATHKDVAYTRIEDKGADAEHDDDNRNQEPKDVAYSRIVDKGTDEEHDDDYRNQEREKKRKYEEVAQTKLDTTEEKDFDPSDADKEKSFEDEPLTRREKVVAIAKLFSLTVVPTFLTFFAYFVSNQAVITTIAFKNAPFRPRDHYLYYVFTLTSGEMFGRCLRSLLSLVSARLHYSPSCKLLWVFCIMEISFLMSLFFESWYRFLPSVAVVIFLCFLAGTVLGSLFDNVLTLLHITFEGKEREFLMAYAMFPMSGGLLAAAFVGLGVESQLRKHCLSRVQDSAYCFTRSPSLRDVTVRCRRH